MTEKLERLLAALRTGLADLPSAEIDRALGYYGEYIAEALEAGRGEDEILQKLGEPAKIIALVKAETSLARAEEHPGPLRLSGAAKGVLHSLTSATARISLIIVSAIPYTLAIGLYVAAVGTFVSAVAGPALMAFGITEMAAGYVREKIGAAGAGIFAAALLVCIGLGLWLAANGITRVTLYVLRRSLRSGAGRDPNLAKGKTPAGKIKTVFAVCALAGTLGIGLVIPSGLPLRYFSIWNSMKPENTTVRAWTFAATNGLEIEAVTLNSMIVLKPAPLPSDKIRVTYEEPDWMIGTAETEGNRLIFREESRGRLPFLGFIAMHEGMTAVTIEVPTGYRVRAAMMTSKGGHVDAALSAGDIQIQTLNGRVRFDAQDGSFTIRARTKKGAILVDGHQVKGGSYTANPGAENIVEIDSTGGTIEII